MARKRKKRSRKSKVINYLEKENIRNRHSRTRRVREGINIYYPPRGKYKGKFPDNLINSCLTAKTRDLTGEDFLEYVWNDLSDPDLWKIQGWFEKRYPDDCQKIDWKWAYSLKNPNIVKS